MNRWLALLLGTDADQNVPVIGPRPHVIGPRPSATVAAPARLAWDEFDWSRTVFDEILDKLELIFVRVADVLRKLRDPINKFVEQEFPMPEFCIAYSQARHHAITRRECEL